MDNGLEQDERLLGVDGPIAAPMGPGRVRSILTRAAPFAGKSLAPLGLYLGMYMRAA